MAKKCWHIEPFSGNICRRSFRHLREWKFALDGEGQWQCVREWMGRFRLGEFDKSQGRGEGRKLAIQTGSRHFIKAQFRCGQRQSKKRGPRGRMSFPSRIGCSPSLPPSNHWARLNGCAVDGRRKKGARGDNQPKARQGTNVRPPLKLEPLALWSKRTAAVLGRRHRWAPEGVAIRRRQTFSLRALDTRKGNKF